MNFATSWAPCARSDVMPSRRLGRPPRLVIGAVRERLLDFLQRQQVVAHVGERVRAQRLREFDGLAAIGGRCLVAGVAGVVRAPQPAASRQARRATSGTMRMGIPGRRVSTPQL